MAECRKAGPPPDEVKVNSAEETIPGLPAWRGETSLLRTIGMPKEPVRSNIMLPRGPAPSCEPAFNRRTMLQAATDAMTPPVRLGPGGVYELRRRPRHEAGICRHNSIDVSALGEVPDAWIGTAQFGLVVVLVIVALVGVVHVVVMLVRVAFVFVVLVCVVLVVVALVLVVRVPWLVTVVLVRVAFVRVVLVSVVLVRVALVRVVRVRMVLVIVAFVRVVLVIGHGNLPYRFAWSQCPTSGSFGHLRVVTKSIVGRSFRRPQ